MMRFFVFVLLTALCAYPVLSQDAVGTFHQEVTWSPDGQYLSFSQLDFKSEGEKNSWTSDIYVVKADGTRLRKITGEAMNEIFSTWSNSGKMLAFSGSVEGSKSSDIFVAARDGGNLKQLTSNAGRNSGPAFSPDGKQIAFTSTRGGDKSQIFIMNANGKNQKAVTDDAELDHYNPQWSPDGKRLVYYSEMGDNKDQIWTIGPDGSNPTLLTNNIGHNIFPSFHPNGKIVFVSTRDDVRGLICTIEPDGSNLEIRKGISVNYIRYSPDGKKIAYITGRFPNSDIYIANADGSDPVKLLED